MDDDTLRHVFANAGERFVYRQEYRAEQADWQDLPQPIEAIFNSRFGVGVFSYFMLADEISVVTRRYERDGVVAPTASVVSVASSGSLFQIASSTGMTRGGTSVKLYLTGDEKISVIRTLRSLLWIAEYRVEVTEGDGAPEIWEAHELRRHGENPSSLKATENLWWVTEGGGVAADGIKTDVEIFGLVVDLRGKQKPTFTVDRQKVREWNEKWLSDEISRSLATLNDWPDLTMMWLWQLIEEEPQIAQQVFTHMSRENAPIPVGHQKHTTKEVSVARLGASAKDSTFFDNSARLSGSGDRSFARPHPGLPRGRLRSRHRLRQDLLVVTRFLDGSAPAVEGTVNQAHIDWAAEELDESADEVRKRLRRFAPLFGYTLPEDTP